MSQQRNLKLPRDMGVLAHAWWPWSQAILPWRAAAKIMANSTRLDVSKPMFAVLLTLVLFAGGCASHNPPPVTARPSISPTSQPTGDPLKLDRSQVRPMYTQMLAIDLPAVVNVAGARNIDIQQARERVEAARGRYETSVENVLPVIAPTFGFEHLEGVNRAVTGQAVAANFNSYLPAIAIQWVLNPGRVIFDIIAAKKRLAASDQQQKATVMETTRAAVVQYYDLALAQARLAVARQAEAESQELLRITHLRVSAGAGLPADELRAQSALSGRQQDLALAANVFYQASITLAVTLDLDASVTLVPQPDQIAQVTLVRDDLEIGQLLELAVQWRPDLSAVRTLAAASTADRKSALWGGFGPQLQAGYQFGGLATHTPGQNISLHEQQRATAGVGWGLGLSTFGQMKTANAVERQSLLEAQRKLDEVRAQVVRSSQDSRTNIQLVPIAKQQVDSAAEALRLAQANLQAGTMLTLDVLQAQDAVDQARLRYADAVVRYNQSQVNLLAAVGLIDGKSLALENSGS